MKLKILKSSKIKINKLSFLNSKYKKYNTLLYDRRRIIEPEDFVKIDSIENVIIGNDYFEYTYIPETTKNIYLGEYKNIDGFVIDFNSFNGHFEYDISNNESLFQEAKVIVNDEIIKIPLGNNIESILVYTNDEKITIEVRTDMNRKEFIIDNKANIKEKKVLYKLCKNNKIINLEELTDFSKVDHPLSTFIDTLIIPTSIVGKKFDAIYDVYVDNIKIVDDNDMKLIPTSNNIEVNGEIELIQRKDKIMIVCYNNSSFDKLISIDKDSNINIIDDKFLLENFPNYKSASLYYNKNKCNLIVNFNTDDKCAVINDDGKIYRLNGIFKSFLINEEEYYDSTLKGILENNISKSSFDLDKLLKKYEEYKKYLRNLKDMGLSTKVLYNSLYKENEDFDTIKMLIKEHKVNEENAKTIDDFGKLLIKK